MKATNSIFQVNNEGKCPFMDSFKNMLDQDMDVTKAMNVLAIGAQLDIQNERFGRLRMKLFKKYGTPVEGEEGKIKIQDENIPAFLEEMNALTGIEFEITGSQVDLSGEKIVLKPRDMMTLRPILTGLPEAYVPEPEEPEAQPETPTE